MKHILYILLCSCSLYIFSGCSFHKECDCMNIVQVDLSHPKERLNVFYEKG